MSRGISKKIDAESRDACEQRREEILDAATELFAEHGYSDAVTQLLADKLQVGKGTIYRHFPSKKDLFLAAADRAMRRLHESIEASLQGIEEPLDRIRAGVRAYLDFFADHPECVELLIQERAQFHDRLKPTYFEHRERSIRRWRDLYRMLIGEGRLRDMPVERITDVFAAMLYGSMFLNYMSGRSGSFSAQADDLLDVAFFGILSESERRKRLDACPTCGTDRTVPEERVSKSDAQYSGPAAVGRVKPSLARRES